jgi:competence protein ComEA
MRLPYFSRAQQTVILLLGAALLLLWVWRANFFLAPSPPPARNLDLVFVEISGAVPHPGVYSFDHPPTLLEALEKAGGPPSAVPANPTVPTGTRIELDREGLPRLSRMNGETLLTLGLALDLNRATAEDLDALPGIGPVLAKRIIDYRQGHGPFKKIDDLMEVSGIGRKKLEKLKPYVVINGQGPAAPDQ